MQDRLNRAYKLQDEDQFRALLPQLITLHLLDNENEGYIFATSQVPEPLENLIIEELKVLKRYFDRKRSIVQTRLENSKTFYANANADADAGFEHPYPWLLSHVLPVLQSWRSTNFQVIEALELMWRCFESSMFKYSYIPSLREVFSSRNPDGFDLRGPEAWLVPEKFTGPLPWDALELQSTELDAGQYDLDDIE